MYILVLVRLQYVSNIVQNKLTILLYASNQVAFSLRKMLPKKLYFLDLSL